MRLKPRGLGRILALLFIGLLGTVLVGDVSAAKKKRKKGKAEKQGTLPKKKILKVIKKNKAAIIDCYDAAKMRQEGAEGLISMRWKIYPEGEVKQVSVVDNDLDQEMGDCLAGEITLWEFPKPKGGVVVVTFPFNFKYVPPPDPTEEIEDEEQDAPKGKKGKKGKGKKKGKKKKKKPADDPFDFGEDFPEGI